MARRRSGKKIDFVHWTFKGETRSAQAAGTVAATIFPALHEPETLLRIRGTHFGYGDGALVSGAQVQIGVGIILVPEGTSTTVLWSPVTDGDAPWIWADYYRLAYEEMVTDVIDIPGMTSYRRVIDNKAMRISRNQEVQVVWELVTIGGALVANVGIDVRILAGK